MVKKDNRKFYQTKTFTGAVIASILLVLQAGGLVVPDLAFQLVTVYTGYSITDRLRK